MADCIIFQHAKLLVAIKNLKLNEETEVIKELNEFKRICQNCFNLGVSLVSLSSEMYKLQAGELCVNLPIFIKFFEDIKEYSKEAYEYITEGYDVLNLKEFLICDGLTKKERVELILGICKYSKYITYAIEKLFKEQNEYKQIIMLRGLIGM